MPRMSQCSTSVFRGACRPDDPRKRAHVARARQRTAGTRCAPVCWGLGCWACRGRMASLCQCTWLSKASPLLCFNATEALGILRNRVKGDRALRHLRLEKFPTVIYHIPFEQ